MGHPMDDIDRLESENHGLRDLVASLRAENAALRELIQNYAEAFRAYEPRCGTGALRLAEAGRAIVAAAKPAAQEGKDQQP